MNEEGYTFGRGMVLLAVIALICVIATNVIVGQIEEQHSPIVGRDIR
jgi:hypothetical protein